MAPQRPLRKYVVDSAESLSIVGLCFDVSSFDPCLYVVYRGSGSAVGVFATHFDDILGCGEPEISPKARNFLGKGFGKLEVQEWPFVHVGRVLGQEKDFSAMSAQADLTKNMKLLPTPPLLWAGRKEPMSMGYIKLRQCRSGELRCVTTAPLADFRARLARIA